MRRLILLFICIAGVGCVLPSAPSQGDFCSTHACIIKTISGSSMEPAIHNGDRVRIGVDYYSFFPMQRGDIVIIDFNVDTILRVKRLVGLSHDLVHLDANGDLAVNEKVVLRHHGGYSLPTNSFVFFQSQPKSTEKIIPSGRVMVLADNSDEGADSRNWGYIDASFLAGKVLEILPDMNA